MKSANEPYVNLTKGDIIELNTDAGTRWGIYIEYARVVHAEEDKTKDENLCSFAHSLLSSRPRISTVKINKIKDLVRSGHFSKNNFKDSFWNKPSSPDKIAERALQEIGYRTHRNSLQFVQYCRYGSDWFIL